MHHIESESKCDQLTTILWSLVVWQSKSHDLQCSVYVFHRKKKRKSYCTCLEHGCMNMVNYM